MQHLRSESSLDIEPSLAIDLPDASEMLVALGISCATDPLLTADPALDRRGETLASILEHRVSSKHIDSQHSEGT